MSTLTMRSRSRRILDLGTAQGARGTRSGPRGQQSGSRLDIGSFQSQSRPCASRTRDDGCKRKVARLDDAHIRGNSGRECRLCFDLARSIPLDSTGCMHERSERYDVETWRSALMHRTPFPAVSSASTTKQQSQLQQPCRHRDTRALPAQLPLPSSRRTRAQRRIPPRCPSMRRIRFPPHCTLQAPAVLRSPILQMLPFRIHREACQTQAGHLVKARRLRPSLSLSARDRVLNSTGTVQRARRVLRQPSTRSANDLVRDRRSRSVSFERS